MTSLRGRMILAVLADAEAEIERLREEVKRARAAALREAARLECDANFDDLWTGYECGVSDMQKAILALIEKGEEDD